MPTKPTAKSSFVKFRTLYDYLNIKPKISNQLTYFSPMFHFYTPWKRQGFMTFSGGIDMEGWAKMGW